MSTIQYSKKRQRENFAISRSWKRERSAKLVKLPARIKLTGGHEKIRNFSRRQKKGNSTEINLSWKIKIYCVADLISAIELLNNPKSTSANITDDCYCYINTRVNPGTSNMYDPNELIAVSLVHCLTNTL